MEDLIPTRQSLLSRLKQWDDKESWNDFYGTYWKLIFLAARKSGLTESESEDVVQETVISVFKRMPEFKYDKKAGSFKAWLLRLTHWRIQDQLRKRHPREVLESSNADYPQAIENYADPAGSVLEAVWEAEWKKNLVAAAIDRTKRRVDPKSYQAFDLCVFQGWPTDKVRSLLKMSRTRVYVAKHRVSILLKKEIRYLDKKMF